MQFQRVGFDFIVLYIYILLSPDAERPPSRPLAHTGARYKISDLSEIYGAVTRNSACSLGGCSSGGEPQSLLFWRRVRRTLAPGRVAGNPRCSLFGGWTLPERNVFGGGIGRKIRAGRSAANYFQFGRTRVCITPVSLHRAKNGSLGTEPQQAVVSWCLQEWNMFGGLYR